MVGGATLASEAPPDELQVNPDQTPEVSTGAVLAVEVGDPFLLSWISQHYKKIATRRCFVP